LDGKAFVDIIEKELKARRISKAEFYEATGISSATFSQWRKQIYCPSSANIEKVGEFLHMRFEISGENLPWEVAGEKAELYDKMVEETPAPKSGSGIPNDTKSKLNQLNPDELQNVDQYIDFVISRREKSQP
jgi:hypothetical protein